MTDSNLSNQLPESNENDYEISFYWQHYGLTQDPFPAVTDPNIYFPLPKWEHHLDLLQHLINNENVLLAIIGEEGQGKTTFLNQVSQLFNDNLQIHQFEADSLFNTRKLIHELELGFDLPVMPKETSEEQLDSQITAVQHKEKVCLLIIDEAHFLPLETINALMFLLKQQSRNQKQLHVILFGDKNLQTKLANLAKHEMNSDMIHTLELDPLTLEETKQYLYFRLNKVGYPQESLFSQIDIEKIYANSKGIPDKINYFAQQMLLNNITKQHKLVNASMFKRHQTKIIGGCLLVIVLIAASYILGRQGQSSAPTTQQAVISFANQSQTITPPTQQQASQQPPTQTNVSASSNDTIIDNTNDQTNTTSANNTIDNNTENAANPANPNSQQNTAATSPIQNNTVVNNTEMQPQSQNVHTQASELPAAAPEAQELIEKQNKIPQVKKVPEVSNVKPAASHPQIHKTKTISRETPIKTKDTRVLKSKGNYYTLQVLGLSSEADMIKFIRQHKLQEDTHYIKTYLNGKPWYILIYGSYKTEQEAVNARYHLPISLKKYRPWPRTFSSIKISMNKA